MQVEPVQVWGTRDADWMLELLIGKYCCQPAHTVAVGWRAAGGASTACLQGSHHMPYAWVTNVANAWSYGTWWWLGIVPDGRCPLLVTANAIFKPYIFIHFAIHLALCTVPIHWKCTSPLAASRTTSNSWMNIEHVTVALHKLSSFSCGNLLQN